MMKVAVRRASRDQVEDRGIAGAAKRAVEQPVAGGKVGRNGFLIVSSVRIGQPVASASARATEDLPRGGHAVDHARRAWRPGGRWRPGPRRSRRHRRPACAARTGASNQTRAAGTGSSAANAAAPAPPPITTQSGLQVVIRLSMAARRGRGPGGDHRPRGAHRCGPAGPRRGCRAAGPPRPDGWPKAVPELTVSTQPTPPADAGPPVGIDAQMAQLPRRAAARAARGPVPGWRRRCRCRWSASRRSRRPRAAPSAASPSRAMVASFSMVTGRPVAASTWPAKSKRGEVDIAARQDPARRRHGPDPARRCRGAVHVRSRGPVPPGPGQRARHARGSRRTWRRVARASITPSAHAGGAQTGAADVDADGRRPCVSRAEMPRDHGLDLAQAGHGDGLQPLLRHRAVQRDAVLPQRPPGDHARCAVGHRGFDLPEERRVVHPRRQHRPGHVARTSR